MTVGVPVGCDESKVELICDSLPDVEVVFVPVGNRVDAAGITLQAECQDDGYSLSGTKLFVPDAHTADLIICAARTGDSSDPSQRISLFASIGTPWGWASRHCRHWTRRGGFTKSLLTACNSLSRESWGKPARPGPSWRRYWIRQPSACRLRWWAERSGCSICRWNTPKREFNSVVP